MQTPLLQVQSGLGQYFLDGFRTYVYTSRRTLFDGFLCVLGLANQTSKEDTMESKDEIKNYPGPIHSLDPPTSLDDEHAIFRWEEDGGAVLPFSVND